MRIADQKLPILIEGNPSEFLVYDELEPCPYLPHRMARFPLRLPIRRLSRAEFDQRLEQGDRRNGNFLYQPSCDLCAACKPIRIDVQSFQFRTTHRRIQRRNDARISVFMSAPVCDDEHVDLYNHHAFERKLTSHVEPLNQDHYARFLTQTCCDSFELQYRIEDKLVGVAIVDRGINSLSAVYCYYDAQLSNLSLGTYSIIKQIELCRSWNLQYLYLGLYVIGSQRMRYKAHFLPHEQLIKGEWRTITSIDQVDVE